MKPAPFDYIALNSIEEITSALNEYGDDAKILAGGQSLVPAMNFRLLQPTMLLDINNVSKLDYVKLNGDKTLKIGALTRQSTIEKDEIIKEKFPLLHETMPQVAHSQIRNRGTIGGNLAHADPASELPAVCIAMGAKLKLISNIELCKLTLYSNGRPKKRNGHRDRELLFISIFIYVYRLHLHIWIYAINMSSEISRISR